MEGGNNDRSFTLRVIQFFIRTKNKVFLSCEYGKNLLHIDRTKGTLIEGRNNKKNVKHDGTDL